MFIVEEKLNDILNTLGSGYPNSLTPEVRQSLFLYFDSFASTVSIRDYSKKYNNDPKVLKGPIEDDWSKYCEEKNPNEPFSHYRLGITTGTYNDLLVLDVDDFDLFNQFLNDNEYSIPDTFMVQSGSGGFHCYFRYPKDGLKHFSKSFKDLGFDIRALGGQVLAVGSIHPETGTIYKIYMYHDIAECPEWLAEMSLKEEDEEDNNKVVDVHTNQNIANPSINNELMSQLMFCPNVGERSEYFMSMLNKLVELKYDDSAIATLVKLLPFGQCAKEKGDKFIVGQIAIARKFYKENNKHSDSKTKINKKEKINVSISKMLQSLQYYSDGESYYIKDTIKNHSAFISIKSDYFNGYINSYILKNFNTILQNNAIKPMVDTLKYNLLNMNVIKVETMTRFSIINNNLILDLGSDTNECVEVSSDGYRIIDQPNVILNRHDKYLPISNIKLNCTGHEYIDKFFDILGMNDKYDRAFILITAMSYLFEQVSSPILYFYGMEGNGKTTLAKAIKSIFDPCKSGLIMNKNLEDLYLNCSKQGVAFIDNFGKVSEDVQNSFCLTFSDGTFSKRKLFHDKETCSIQIKCPLILSSLAIPKSIQSDFIDRTAFFYIKKSSMIIADEDLQNELADVIGFVRGEVLNLASEVLKIKNQFKPSNRTRYADFDKLAYAACVVLYNNANFYDEILDDREYKNKKCLMWNNPEIIEFARYIKDVEARAFTMAELSRELYNFSGDVKIKSLALNYLSANINKYKDYLEDKEGIYVFEGKKISNKYMNGIPYFACTKKYLEDNNLTPDDLVNDQSLVNNFYKNQETKLNDAAIDAVLG